MADRNRPFATIQIDLVRNRAFYNDVKGWQVTEPHCYISDVVNKQSCSYDSRGTGTDPFAMIQILFGTDLVPRMAEADRNRPFCYDSDLVPRMAEADRNRPFFYDSDLVRNISYSYDGRGRQEQTLLL